MRLLSSLVSGLVLFTFPGCSTDLVEENSVNNTTKEITDFIASLEKESPTVIKTGVLASLGTLLEDLIKETNKDDITAIKTKIKTEVDKLALTSTEVKKEATKIQTTAIAFVTKKKSPTTDTKDAEKEVANKPEEPKALTLAEAFKTLEDKETALSSATEALTALAAKTVAAGATKETLTAAATKVVTAATEVVTEAEKTETAAATTEAAKALATTVVTTAKATKTAADAAVTAINTGDDAAALAAAKLEAVKVTTAETPLTEAIAALKTAVEAD